MAGPEGPAGPTGPAGPAGGLSGWEIVEETKDVAPQPDGSVVWGNGGNASVACPAGKSVLGGGYRVWSQVSNGGQVEPVDEVMQQPYENPVESGWQVYFGEAPDPTRVGMEITVYATCADSN